MSSSTHFITRIYDWGNMEINTFNFLLTTEMLRNLCTRDFALSNCQACDNHTPKKKPLIKSKNRKNLAFKLNIVRLGTFKFNHTLFMARFLCDCKQINHRTNQLDSLQNFFSTGIFCLIFDKVLILNCVPKKVTPRFCSTSFPFFFFFFFFFFTLLILIVY